MTDYRCLHWPLGWGEPNSQQGFRIIVRLSEKTLQDFPGTQGRCQLLQIQGWAGTIDSVGRNGVKSFLLIVVGMIVGALVALVLAAGYFTGVGAGAGILTGLKAGACLTIEAAKEQGYITAEQVDGVLNAAVKQIASADLGNEVTLSGSDSECAKVVADLKQAAQK